MCNGFEFVSSINSTNDTYYCVVLSSCIIWVIFSVFPISKIWEYITLAYIAWKCLIHVLFFSYYIALLLYKTNKLKAFIECLNLEHCSNGLSHCHVFKQSFSSTAMAKKATKFVIADDRLACHSSIDFTHKVLSDPNRFSLLLTQPRNSKSASCHIPVSLFLQDEVRWQMVWVLGSLCHWGSNSKL